MYLLIVEHDSDDKIGGCDVVDCNAAGAASVGDSIDKADD